MNVLSIPQILGGHSHLIPLFVFHQRYLRRLPNIKNFFLVNERSRLTLRHSGVSCIDVDYEVNAGLPINKLREVIFEAEKKSFDLVKPDIILEDNCFTSPLIAEKYNIPRISIHRTGFFRSIPLTQRKNNHCHSVEKDEYGRKSNDLMSFLTKTANSIKVTPDEKLLRNYLHTKTKIVPGIRSIEILPSNIDNPQSYFFSGPLIVQDDKSEPLNTQLREFFERNSNRKKVFLTLGLVDNSAVGEYIDYLLNKEYCVITTVNYIPRIKNVQSRYFYAGFFPLNFVAASVDLIIHQCGSGIYHYPILHGKPFITLGTLCYDREDVALILQSKGISKHVPNPKDNNKHFYIFINYIRQFEKSTLCDFNCLLKLKEEIYQTMLNFDIENVIQYTLK